MYCSKIDNFYFFPAYFSLIKWQLKPHLRGIYGDCDVTGNDVTGSREPEVTSPDMTSPEMKGRSFPAFFPPGISRDFPRNSSRFLVRTMELWIQPVSGHNRPITPYVKPFFTPQLCSQPWLIDSVVCMQYMTAFSMFFCLFVVFVNKMLFIIRGFTL